MLLLSPPDITCTPLRRCFHKNIDQISEIANASTELESYFFKQKRHLDWTGLGCLNKLDVNQEN